MDALHNFLNMGGYAVWVWSAYGVSALGLIGLLAWSVRTLKVRQKEFDALKNARS